MLSGVFPILATCFGDDGAIDYDSQKRLIDWCIENGVHGLVTLANASEGHLLSDAERGELSAFVLREAKGRVPIIVTVNHPSSHAACASAREAEANGAAAVMAMPPFFGRWRAGTGEITRFYEALDDALSIPIVIQDHVLSDIAMPVPYLAELASRFEQVQYVKLEAGNIIHKARHLLAACDDKLAGVFGGNSGIFLPEEVQAGCCGTMPACYMPDVFRKTWDLLEGGERDAAHAYFAPFSRLAAYEKEVANRCVWKVLLVDRGVIASGAVREPAPAHREEWMVAQLREVAGRAGLLRREGEKG